MSIANLLLVIWILLISCNYLGWLSVSGIIIDIIGLITAIMMLVSGLGAADHTAPTIRRGQ